MFLFSENLPSLSYTAMQNSKIFRGQFVLGGGDLFSFSKNVPKLSYSNAEFKKFLWDNTPDSRFSEDENWFYFSENVPKRSYSIAEFQKFPKVPDPRFWEGEGKLPPLEIMSGYATVLDTNICKSRPQVMAQPRVKSRGSESGEAQIESKVQERAGKGSVEGAR